MKIGFLVNSIETEKAGFTTTRLACEAINKGHEAYVFGVGDLAYDSDEYIRARARTVSKTSYGSHETFFKEIYGAKAVKERITVDDLDAIALDDDRPLGERGTSHRDDASVLNHRHGVQIGHAGLQLAVLLG